MVPIEWTQNFGYFITYFGDVYFGIAIQVQVNVEGFYVLSKNRFREYQKLHFADEQLKYKYLERVGILIGTEKIVQTRIPEEEFQDSKYTTAATAFNPERFNCKTMYVFGAGASAFCQFGVGLKAIRDAQIFPPLGNELFDSRFDKFIIKYPGVKMLVPKFETRGNNIEAILEDDWSELMKSMNKELASQHIQLQFYFRELFEVVSNEVSEKYFRYSLHSIFVQKLLNRWTPENRSSLVSFNYDTILELALEQQFGIQFNDIEKYVNQGDNTRFMLFKPHGSWNWGWAFDDAITESAKIPISEWLYNSKATPADIYYKFLGKYMLSKSSWGAEARNDTKGIGKLNPNKANLKLFSNDETYFPALLVPYRDKDEFIMPYHHQTGMEFVMTKVEELVLIGWKGNEKLFNDKLKKRVRKLKKITIANPDIESVKNELSKYLDLTKYEIQEARNFEDYVLNYMN